MILMRIKLRGNMGQQPRVVYAKSMEIQGSYASLHDETDAPFQVQVGDIEMITAVKVRVS